METMQIHSRIRADGVLRLDLPLGLEQADADVLITIEPVVRCTTQETWGGFLSETFGAMEQEEKVPIRCD